MAANVYECMFILDTTKVAGDIAAADKQIRAVLEKHSAEVLVSRPWDERRLAYPITQSEEGSLLHDVLLLRGEERRRDRARLRDHRDDHAAA